MFTVAPIGRTKEATFLDTPMLSSTHSIVTGRVAALELGENGIRVNTIHPNAVYDTAIWTDEVLKARAKHYKLSVKEYKTNNVLRVEVTSQDVADLAVSMLGNTYSKITGAQVPIDGGNDRVI